MVNISAMDDTEAAAVAEYTEWVTGRLAMLREPFPPERIEKRPQPKWKNAWDNQPSSQCDECDGYHPVGYYTTHLEYVGHANATDRLLEVDPFWEWEPMAYTPEGLPLFVKEGLWIKLTICGVTRIGFGDGKSIKEVIGDAIRNAAMRFGLALDLWSRVDLHEALNRQAPSRVARDDSGDQDAGRARGGNRSGRAASASAVASDPAPNQDALDELGSVCDRHGYDRRSMGPMFEEWAKQQDPQPNPRLIDSDADAIRLFAASLVAMAELGPPDDAGDSAVSGAEGPVGSNQGDGSADESTSASGSPESVRPSGDADVDSGAGSAPPPDPEGMF